MEEPLKGFDDSLDFKAIGFRQHPELYRIGRGEQGVLYEQWQLAKTDPEYV